MDNMVEDFEYNPVENTVKANIHGSLGVYSIDVRESKNQIVAECDCPFDGYPCKHIVAVLLYYLHNKDNFIQSLEKEQKDEKLLKDKLFSLKKEEIIEIVLSFLNEYPSVKRELFLHLSISKESTLKHFYKEVDKVLRDFERDTFSTYEIGRKLREIIKQSKAADDEIKVEILWKIIDGILHQLNEFGMDDMTLENLVIESMDLLVKSFNSVPGLDNRRKEIQAEIERYCNWGNCGIVDDICDIAFEISDESIGGDS